MSLSILSLGTALPSHTMSQDEATELAHATCATGGRERRLLDALYRKAGVKNRHTCLPHQVAFEWSDGLPDASSAHPHGPSTLERMQMYETLALPLALSASRQALSCSEFGPEDITHLVSVTCTGFYAPGVDVHLIRELGLPPDTQRVQVGFMGCHGALNGLRVGQGLIAADPAARILLSAVELCCLHYRLQWDPERMLGNALFADGAGSLLMGAEPCPQATPGCRLLATGSYLIPDSMDAMTWRIGDNGFEMTLAPTVPDLIRQHLGSWLTSWLAKYELSIPEIEAWVVHPGGPRILTAVEESLELPQDALQNSRQVLSEMGNMSSPTVLFILERFFQQGSSGPFLLLGFGPGLTAEVALLV